MSTINAEKAKEIILDQIRVEVILGHNAIAVFIALSEHSQALNDLPFKQALGSVQHHAMDAFILSLCKLYEKPNKRYPNYSIPTTLTLLKETASDLTGVLQRHVLLEKFIQKHIDPTFAVVDQNCIGRIPSIILNHFLKECPCTPPRDGNGLDHILNALKVLRDKRVAHHEDADLSVLSKTDLDGALRLLAFAQTYVNIVGYGFFGFPPEGEVAADRFKPCKSVVYPEMKRIISLLKQTSVKDEEKLHL